MDRIKHLPIAQIDKLIKEDENITIKGYIELCKELEDIAATQLPLEVVEKQRARRTWNRIRNQQKEKV